MKIAAVLGNVGTCKAHEYVERMCRSQIARDWHSYETIDVVGGAVGIIKTSESFGKIPMFLQSGSGNILAISGVPTKRGHLKSFLQQVVEMPALEAEQALRELGGAYAVFFWDACEEKALLSTDFAGFQPVYIHRAPKGLAIASEIKAFAVSGIVPVQADPAGWGAFFILGHSVGDATQLCGVSRLRGNTITYKPSDNTYRCSRNWSWPDRMPELSDKDLPIGSIIRCFKEDIASYREYTADKNTLLMSSGFDSRFLLGLLVESGLPIETLSVQQPKHFFGAEGKLGQQIAWKCGVNNPRLVSVRSGIEDLLATLRCAIMNDVATPGLSLFISRVAGYVYALSGAVWEGFAPGQALTQLTDLNWPSYLRKRGLDGDSDAWKAVSLVFKKDFFEEMKARTLEVVSNERSEYGEDDYGLTRFIFRNRALHRIAPNPMKVYGNSVLTFTPGASRGLWDLMYRFSPSKMFPDKRVIKRILSEFYPESLSVPFCTERGLSTASGKLSAYVTIINMVYGLDYIWERRRRMPYIGKLFPRIGPSKLDWLDLMGELMDADIDYLKPGYRERIMSKDGEITWNTKARNAVAYFVLWNGVMKGRLNAMTCQKLLLSKTAQVESGRI